VASELLDVGRIVRPHGVAGAVVVELWTNRTERLDPGSILQGDGAEWRVASTRRLPQGRWLVRFDGVNDREQAERMRGVVLQAAPLQVEGALWVHELIGVEVVDAEGTPIGVVAAVEANPASDLLVLADGRLIPLGFVVSSEPGRLTVSPPPGLLDL
jgi:16S rRNA processing protein RimM